MKNKKEKRIIVCMFCKVDFYSRNIKKFCSHKCYSNHNKSGKDVNCLSCDKVFYSSISKAKKFCSTTCQKEFNCPRLEGKKFGYLLVVGKSRDGKLYPSNKKSRTIWECKCDCGNKKEALSNHLLSGVITSCGCKSLHHKRPFGVSYLNKFYNGYRDNSMRRGIEFNISHGEFIDTIKKKCNYCGNLPSLRKDKNSGLNGTVPVNGIDRTDSNGGYTLGNCVPCCSICNTMKMALSENDFLSHIQKIAAFQGNKGKKFPPSYLTVVA